MNIAILHYSVPPIVGGVESVIAHHARMISNDGHSVCLIAARGEAMNDNIPLIRLPLANSRHERVTTMNEELKRGEVTEHFETLREEIMGDFRKKPFQVLMYSSRTTSAR